MEESLRIGERRCALVARQAGPGTLDLQIDGSAHRLGVVASSDGCHLVESGAVLEPLFTARSAAGTWVWHRGRSRLVERVPRERPTARPAGAGTDAPAPGRPGPVLPAGAVTPPMPAVVVAVLVAEGREVSRGDPLVVVSAMKTESQLVAPLAGRVKRVGARVGARVRPGEILVEVEPEGGRDAR